MDLYIHKNGQNIGPLTPEQALEGIREGRFQLNDYAITRDIQNWLTLEEVLDLLESQVNPKSTATWRDSLSSLSQAPKEPYITSQPVEPQPTPLSFEDQLKANAQLAKDIIAKYRATNNEIQETHKVEVQNARMREVEEAFAEPAKVTPPIAPYTTPKPRTKPEPKPAPKPTPQPTPKSKSGAKEYRRECHRCGKVWHSLVKREEELNRRQSMNEPSDCCCCGSSTETNCCGGETKKSKDTRQKRLNADPSYSELTRLKKCPDCHSTNYKEIIV